jgi:hypothetical protein
MKAQETVRERAAPQVFVKRLRPRLASDAAFHESWQERAWPWIVDRPA